MNAHLVSLDKLVQWTKAQKRHSYQQALKSSAHLDKDSSYPAGVHFFPISFNSLKASSIHLL